MLFKLLTTFTPMNYKSIFLKTLVMKKILPVFACFFLLVAFTSNSNEKKTNEEEITLLLDNWHEAAATANAENYFGAMTNDARFVGTDATENWTKTEFQIFANPFFKKGKAWDFKPLERHIYISKDKKTAWFDELLDTWMKVCRGSGVVVKVGNAWKIQHYVLSMTVPNDVTNEVIKSKSPIENPLIEKLKSK